MIYLLDANAFMEASRHYYAFDLAPGFWTWLGSTSHAGQIASIGAVKDEIMAGEGELVDWASARPASFWLQPTPHVVTAMRQVAAWAAAPERPYRPAAVDAFMDSADFELVAYALAVSGTVITREQPAPEAKKSVKIPDVCDAFDVPWTDPFSMYRSQGLRLVA